MTENIENPGPGHQMDVDSLAMQRLQSNSGSGESPNKEANDKEEKHTATKQLLSTQEQEEEDESHLPPGVRKKNRCHSSSSSSSNTDSEEEAKLKKSSKEVSDDSDSASSDDDIKKVPKEEIKKAGQDSGHSQKAKLRSASRSRSKSHSPAAKRRLSSERSGKRSRSRSTDRRHHKREKKGRRRSSSTSRRRSRDRDHHRRKRRGHSRDRKRSRSRDRRRSRSHERRRSSRSRSRDRRRSRSREKKRSRSRSHDRRDRHRDKGGRSRGNRRSRDAKSLSRSRSRSPRGGKVIKYGDKVIKAGASFGRPPSSKPMTFKEKMRQQLIKAMEEGGDASQALTDKDGTVICLQTAGTMQLPQPNVPPPPKKPPVPLMANLVTSTASLQAATISASEAAMQSMIALQKETEEKTGVEIPKYYNPAAINPVKYAEQVQKRKLLWSKTKDKDVNSQWNATGLSSEHDDKSKEKFRKLMGIKGVETAVAPGAATEEGTAEEQEKELKQRELFDKLDKEYQFARMATHTHRGIGLGFGSATSYQPPPT